MTGRQIFHLTTATEWERAQADGQYRAAGYDEEGFIHFSNPDQVERTYGKFYADVPDLVLLTVDVDRLGEPSIVDEPGDPGSDVLFPHLYRPLPVDAVVEVRPYP
jgi:glutathione S-transferase